MDLGHIKWLLITFGSWAATEVYKTVARWFIDEDVKPPNPAIVNALVASGIGAGMAVLEQGPYPIIVAAAYAILGVVSASFTHNAGHVARAVAGKE